jgi:hypothetical protein
VLPGSPKNHNALSQIINSKKQELLMAEQLNTKKKQKYNEAQQ